MFFSQNNNLHNLEPKVQQKPQLIHILYSLNKYWQLEVKTMLYDTNDKR